MIIVIRITTQQLHTLTSEKLANLAIKNDIAAVVKRIDFEDKLKKLNKKAASNKSKYLLKYIEKTLR